MHSKAKRLLTLLLGPVLSLAVSASWADLADRSTVNMSPGATALGLDIYDLHMLVIWISVGIGVACIRRDVLLPDSPPQVPGTSGGSLA
jgi:hypothetical protein